MRVVCLILCIAGCYTRAATKTQPQTVVRYLLPRPHMRAAIAACRGDAGSSEVSIANAGIEADAPLVTLQETHMHGGGPPSPTIAIWADGEVLFAGTRDGVAQLLTTVIPASEATEVAHQAYRGLDDVPRYTDVFDATGGTLLSITVRDGNQWRSSAVYGDDPERVLAVARGTATPPKPKPAVAPGSQGPLDEDFSELLAERPWPPMGFARAYAYLVDHEPTAGKPFEGYDFDVLFITPERGIRPELPALPWPSDLPRPGPELRPANCRYNESDDLDFDGACHYILGRSYKPAGERFERVMWNGGDPRGVSVNGTVFAVRFDEKYRGERTIDALTTCAEVLSSEAK